MKIYLGQKTLFLVIITLLAASLTAHAQSTAFNFQGRLNDGSSAANGRYDLQFKLFDAIAGGNQIRFPGTPGVYCFLTPLDF